MNSWHCISDRFWLSGCSRESRTTRLVNHKAGYACMLKGKQWFTSSKTLIKHPNAFFQVQRENFTHYVSGDLRFSFESNDGIPLKQKLRANQIPLYILRGLSRRWGLRVCERYGQKKKEKVHNVQSIVLLHSMTHKCLTSTLVPSAGIVVSAQIPC